MLRLHQCVRYRYVDVCLYNAVKNTATDTHSARNCSKTTNVDYTLEEVKSLKNDKRNVQ